MTRLDLTCPPQHVAPRLLGCLISVTAAGSDVPVVARVVEVEAYGGVGADPGSHAHRGPTRRNATMFGPVGRLYVYFSYGMHWCANIVAHDDGVAGAVLLRAATITSGMDVARARRGQTVPDRDLARGPARLTKALGLSGADEGSDLLSTGSRVRLLPGLAATAVHSGPRVGVSGDGSGTPWRWWDTASREVSAYRPAVARQRTSARKGHP